MQRLNKNPNLRRCDEPHTECKECPIRSRALFRGVPEEKLGWTQEFRDAQYLLSARETLYRQGETAHSLYTLFDGWLALYKILDNGKRQILRFVLPGDFIGFQVSGIGPAAGHMHSSQALIESTLCTFPAIQLRSMMEKLPQLAIRLAEMEMHDMNLCQHHMIGTARKSARERIAFLMLELFYRVRLQMENGYDEAANSIIFPLTQRDIADAVGLTPVHVNRTLNEMVEIGLIKCPGKRLTILNEEALMEIGEFDPGLILTKSLI
ncbi:MAG: Crp/Fnr family transcriptional regulator [Pseudomonadota bacterium]